MSYTTTVTSPLRSPTPNRSPDYQPFRRTPSMGDFQIERIPKSPQTVLRTTALRRDEYENNEQAFRSSVARLLTANARPFAVSGQIPLDSSTLVLFFRSKVNRTTFLPFPRIKTFSPSFHRQALPIPSISRSMWSMKTPLRLTSS
jgi:hypothetical protein